MSNIHIILQGKGGVGKSYVAFLMGQYFQSKGHKTLLLDTDPSNHTFSKVESLGVQHYDITDGDDVNQGRFDGLLTLLADFDGDEIVMDNGSGGYISFVSYLASSGAIEELQDMGHQVFLHSVIVGAENLSETFGSFKKMTETLPNALFVLWLNHHLYGQIEHGGQSLLSSKTLKSLGGQLRAVIELPKRKEEVFGRDIRQLMGSHLTFEEAVVDQKFHFMTRKRLRTVWKETRAVLQDAGLETTKTTNEGE